MRLYYTDFLSAHRACATARYLGLDVDFHYLDPMKGESKAPAYLALNPNGKVPTLVDGDRVLFESDAIICHLARRAGSDLWPADPDAQIDIIRWFSWSAQHFTRATGSLYFENIIRARFGLGPPDAAAVEAALADFHRYAAVLDAHLAGRDWLVGDGLTVADFTVAQALPFAAKARIPVGGYANLSAWRDRLNAIPAWREGFPARD